MMAVFGLLIGASGVRFWWHGVAALLGLSILLCIIGTVGALNDPLVKETGASITVGSIVYGLSVQFCVLLIGYGIGAGGRWLFRKASRSRT